MDDAAGDTAVAGPVPDALAPACIDDFLCEQGFIVAVLEIVGVDDTAAGRLLRGQMRRVRAILQPPESCTGRKRVIRIVRRERPDEAGSPPMVT